MHTLNNKRCKVMYLGGNSIGNLAVLLIGSVVYSTTTTKQVVFVQEQERLSGKSKSPSRQWRDEACNLITIYFLQALFYPCTISRFLFILSRPCKAFKEEIIQILLVASNYSKKLICTVSMLKINYRCLHL